MITANEILDMYSSYQNDHIEVTAFYLTDRDGFNKRTFNLENSDSITFELVAYVNSIAKDGDRLWFTFDTDPIYDYEILLSSLA